MKKNLQLNIPNPCEEKWEQMQPETGGRFCMQCSTKVIDFTGLSNAEILQIIEKSKGGICGRMFQSQTNRPIEIPRKAKSKSKLFQALAGIFLIGTTGNAFSAPFVPKANKADFFQKTSNYQRIDLKQIQKNRVNDTIKGQVFTIDEDPIPGATILNKETDSYIETKLDGSFSFDFPKDVQQDFVNILVSFPGYETLETRIYKNDGLATRNFYLKEIEFPQEEGTIIITMGRIAPEYVESNTTKTKWWQFWKKR